MPRFEAKLELVEDRAPGLDGTAGALEPPEGPAPALVAIAVGKTNEVLSLPANLCKVVSSCVESCMG